MQRDDSDGIARAFPGRPMLHCRIEDSFIMYFRISWFATVTIPLPSRWMQNAKLSSHQSPFILRWLEYMPGLGAGRGGRWNAKATTQIDPFRNRTRVEPTSSPLIAQSEGWGRLPAPMWVTAVRANAHDGR